jgi:protein SCO1
MSDDRSRPSWLERFFGGWRFPAYLLSVLLFSKILVVVLLAVPADAGDLGAFADDFRIWCFGYDPDTGKMEWAYTATILMEPLLLGAAVLLLWRRPLQKVLAMRASAFLPWIGAGLLTVTTIALGLGIVGLEEAVASDELPFPGESIRTHHPAPAFELTNHLGEPFGLADLEGEVAVLTAVYARCAQTCPMILEQAKGVMSALAPEEQARVRMVVITLEPERDTPEALGRMARAQNVSAPGWQLLGGDPVAVNRLLDELGIERRKNEKTGDIDHANIFALVDRSGRVAYRFTLGERQARWTVDALRALLAEASPDA